MEGQDGALHRDWVDVLGWLVCAAWLRCQAVVTCPWGVLCRLQGSLLPSMGHG